MSYTDGVKRKCDQAPCGVKACQRIFHKVAVPGPPFGYSVATCGYLGREDYRKARLGMQMLSLFENLVTFSSSTLAGDITAEDQRPGYRIHGNLYRSKLR